MRLYHGTTASAVEKIMAEGLRPRRHHGASNWRHTIESHEDAVYLSTAYAPYFGIVAANEEAERRDDGAVPRVAVLEIETDYLDPARLVADEDAVEQILRRQKTPANYTQAVMIDRTKKIRDQMTAVRYDWQASLSALGNCAYLDAIPTSAITRVATFDPVAEAAYSMSFLDCQITTMNYRHAGKRYRAWTARLFGDAPAAEDMPLEFGVTMDGRQVWMEYELDVIKDRAAIDVTVLRA